MRREMRDRRDLHPSDRRSPARVIPASKSLAPALRRILGGRLSWSLLLCRVLCVPRYRSYWVTPIPPLPRRFGRTDAVFPRYRPPSSIGSRVHPLVSFALLQSTLVGACSEPFGGERLPWGFRPSSRRR
jgi:hypothetical protein